MSQPIDAKAALQMAYAELARRRAEIETLRRERHEAVAVIGMACRFPGDAVTPAAFWELLASGTDATTEIPRDRWNADAYYDKDPAAAGKMATRRGAFLRDVDSFDCQFFGIAPKAAQLMDPQQRLLLEVAWEALESANLAAAQLYGTSTGVFVGLTCFDQAMLLGKTATSNAHAGTSSALNMAAGRLSYTLGLNGPSLVIDTACSSSLVAIHIACQSLRSGEAALALAGGAHTILSPEVMVSFSQARMLAADGRCKTFDAAADGYARGEGCGVVVLKLLSKAQADGDRVLGVIRGSAVNQDGASGGLTIPSGAAQQAVIRAALEQAQVAPSAVSYVEAHGTGTALGDPIEIEAVARAYGDGRAADAPLFIGAVKTNIGHLEPAAGIAGLIKVLLAFQHQQIPPHLHCRQLNPHVRWDEIPVVVATEAVEWRRRNERRRLAGISAFGFSGTNAHLIVEEPPVVESSNESFNNPSGETTGAASSGTSRAVAAPSFATQQTAYLLPLSAKSEAALVELARRYRQLLDNTSDDAPPVNLGALCYHASVGRSHFNHRLALVVASVEDARRQLDAFLSGNASSADSSNELSNELSAAPDAVIRSDSVIGQSVVDAGVGIGELIQQLATAASAQRRELLRRLAGFYVGGAEIDWRSVLGEARPPQVALPTYPFQRQRCRLADDATTFLQSHLYAVDWQQQPAPAFGNRQQVADALQAGDAWLIFSDGGNEGQSVGRQLSELLRQHRQSVIEVFVGESYERLSETARRLNPTDASHYRQLLAEFFAAGDNASHNGDRTTPTTARIVHLWSLDVAANEALDDAGLRAAEQTGCLALLHLTAALAGMAQTSAAKIATHLWTVTRGAVAIEAMTEMVAEAASKAVPETINVAQSPLWGFAKVMALEHPELFKAAIDLDPASLEAKLETRLEDRVTAAREAGGEERSGAQGISVENRVENSKVATQIESRIETNIEMLLAEMLAADAETQIVWRDGKRYVPRLTRAALPATQRLAIATEATYAITGGLGSLGLRVARWLVGEGAKHLLLIGRRPPRSAAVNAAIGDLQARGAQIHIALADVADGEQLAAVFARFAAESKNASVNAGVNASLPAGVSADVNTNVPDPAPPLRGIVHCAGLGGYTDIDRLQPAELAAVLRPKVSGSWQLHRLTEGLRLDFFICFSSIASAWGSRGQAHYAAANSFLDALAHYRQSQQLAAISINWGPWAESGMISAEAETLLRRVGATPMAADDAVAALAYLPATNRAQAIVAEIDWERFAASYEVKGRRPLLERLRQTKPAATVEAAQQTAEQTAFRRQLEQLSADERAPFLLAAVRQQAAEALGLLPPEVSVEDGLFEMGMDSLMALEFRSRLEATIAHALPATLVFDYPTIASIAAFLLQEVLALGDDSPQGAQTIERDAAHATHTTWRDEPIAIIGMSCRFPGGADNAQSYWQLLRAGVDAVTEVPGERWNVDDYYDADPETAGKMYSRHGGFLREVAGFDAAFFRISPREAVSLDPQQRLALEVSWEALEDAGQSADALKGSQTGVFIGITTNDYAQLLRANAAQGVDGYFFTGNPLNTTAGRISYTLGLEGPSLAIDTACSSSLVAIHVACQSLRSGEATLALAGGVNLILTPDNTVAVCRTRALSPAGRCKTFDAAADGFVRSEGCGIVVLKLLAKAQADGDRVLGVIRGSAVNQDGASSGFTVPNGRAQQAVMRRALGDIPASAVNYVEAHGTGTALGDPIEVLSLASVFGEARDGGNPLLVGSVKTNIGHAESAAGIASLIKVVLGLVNEELPPSLHFTEPNPHIPWQQLPVQVCDSLRSWRRGERRRLAGVSAFGASGTNAHVLIEEAPEVEEAAKEAGKEVGKEAPPLETGAARAVEPTPYLLTLSAKTSEALRELAARYHAYLADGAAAAIADICFTASVGRAHFAQRLALVCASATEAAEKLRDFLAGNPEAAVSQSADAGQPQGDQQALSALRKAEMQPLAPDRREWLEVVAKSYCQGSEMDWTALYADEPRRRVALPTYPFQRKRFWIHEGKAAMELQEQATVKSAPERRRTIEDALRRQIAELMQAEVDEVPLHLPFLEMGADSIVLVEAVHLIETEFGIKLSVRQFFEELSTISALAAYLDEQLPATAAETVTPANEQTSALTTNASASAISVLPPLAAAPITPSSLVAPVIANITSPVAAPIVAPEVTPDATNAALQPITTPTTSSTTPSATAPPTLARSDGDAALASLERILTEQSRVMAQLMNQQLEVVRQTIGGASSGAAQQSSTLQTANGQTVTAQGSTSQAAISQTATPALSASPVAPTTAIVEPTTAQSAERATRQPTPQPTPQAAQQAAQKPAQKPAMPWGHQPERQARGLSERQAQHLDSLIARFTARTRKSKEMAAAARPVLADSRASVGFRFSTKELLYPITGVRSSGSRTWDIDGNEYIDFTMGFGVHLFGHQPPFIQQAIAEEFERGLELGARSPWAGEAALRLCQLTGHERVAFSNTGTEAVMTALRLARATTGRDLVAIFNNSYHGHSDGTLARLAKVSGEWKTAPMVAGVPAGVVERVLVLDYGTDEALDVIKARGNELAAVMVEPVQSRQPTLQPRDFLAKLRELTMASGTALIFDEMITGFRVHPGGAQAFFGVQADLATYGKIIGGGLPIGVIGGTARFMDGIDGGAWNYGDATFPAVERTAFGGTFCQHPLSMAAARAVLQHLQEEGAELQERLNRRTAAIAAELNDFFAADELPIRVVYFASLFRFEFTANLDLLFYHLLERGIYIWEWRSCFLSTAHTDEDVAHFIRAVKESIAELQDGGFLPPPKARRALGATPHAAQGVGQAAAPTVTPTTSQAAAQTAAPISAPTAAAAVAPAPVSVEQSIPLSEAQKQIWLATEIDRNYSLAYNVNTTLELAGRLDAELLERALARVVARHEALRTRLDAAGAAVTGEAQIILHEVAAHLARHDLSALAEAEQAQALAQWRVAESRRAFDLTKAPLWRADLLKLSAERHVLSLTAHHIIADGATMGILVEELLAFYWQASEGKANGETTGEARGATTTATAIAAAPPMQFREYLALCEARRQTPEMAAHEAYWLAQLAEPLPVLQLPCDRVRPAVASYRSGRLNWQLDAETTGRLRRLAREHGATLYMTLLAGFTLMLHRVTGQADVIVGTPVAGRSFPGSNRVVGYCTHVMPLRSRLDDSLSFSDYLRAMRKNLLDAFDHQDFPFAELVARRREQRDVVQTPLVSAIFNLEPTGAPPPLGDLQMRLLDPISSFTPFDLSLNVLDNGATLTIDCDYSADLFEEASVRRLLGVYETLLRAALETPLAQTARLPLLTTSERQRLLIEYNATAAYPQGDCIHHLFEAQAARTPEAVALVYGRERFTYRQLDEQANQLAHHLRSRGVGAESLVGVCLERTPLMVKGLLAILKAGGAYVPFDPAYPRQRLAFMLDDAKIRLVLTQSALAGVLPKSFAESGAETLNLDALDWQALPAATATAPPVTVANVTPENLAYIIYTSGSTGLPKGVAIRHSSVVELAHWSLAVFGVEPLAGMLMSTSICFDLSAFELFVPLSCGGKVILARNALELASLPTAAEVTMINTVPSSLAELLKTDSIPTSVRVVGLAGEALHRQLVQRLYERGHIESVYNLYGPSEDTTYSTFARLRRDDEREPSIGRPIANTQLYILDANLEPLPAGVAGELFIGGAGLSRGYLNRPQMTAERFIPDPFSGKPGARLYRTGDRARYREDGEVEFLGRIDRQIKLRGFRIELGEIEAALLQHPAIEEAVVVLRGDHTGDHTGVNTSDDNGNPERVGNDTNKRLLAYLVLLPEQQAATEELRRYLRERLPEPMIPAQFLRLAELPRLPNGKVNRAALPAPETLAATSAETSAETTASYLPPTNEIEATLANIWETALGKVRVGIEDDFYELGGNSLLATRVAAQIYQRLHRKVALRTLFANPTIRALARRLARFEQIAYAPIAPIEEREAYELSPAQRRFWVQDRLASPASKVAQPVAFLLEGEFDDQAFERAFQTLIERHEMLRTAFVLDGREPRQVVQAARDCGLAIRRLDWSADFRDGLNDVSRTDDVTNEAAGEATNSAPYQVARARLRELAHSEARAPMELASGRLMRVTLVKLAADQHVCLCALHHIITDGWSNVVLLNEFLTLYAAYARGAENPLAPLPVQYKDYAIWLNRQLDGGEAANLRAYWLAQLGGKAPVNWQLPTDVDRARARAYQKRSHRLTIPEAEVRRLESLCQQRGATLFMGLLAAIKVLLYRYSGAEEIVVGTPVAGRVHPDLENQIGPYLNVLPLFDMVRGDEPFAQLLERLRETTLDAYAHQLYPFDFLVSDLGLKREAQRNPIFDVGFTLQNQNRLAMSGDVAGLKLTALTELGAEDLEEDLEEDRETETPEALTDFWFIAEPRDAAIDLLIVYNGSLFLPQTVERLAADLTAIVQAVTTDPEVTVGDIRFASQATPQTQRVSINIAFSQGD